MSKSKSAPKKKLDPVQEKAAKRLARELWQPGSRFRDGTLKALAAELRVTTRTVQKWSKLPEFIEEVTKHLDRFDDAFDRGLEISLQGDGENLAPNASVLIWYGKTRFRRDERLSQQSQKHKHVLQQIEKKSELGLPVDGEGITYKVTVTEAPMPGKPEPEEGE